MEYTWRKGKNIMNLSITDIIGIIFITILIIIMIKLVYDVIMEEWK